MRDDELQDEEKRKKIKEEDGHCRIGRWEEQSTSQTQRRMASARMFGDKRMTMPRHKTL